MTQVNAPRCSVIVLARAMVGSGMRAGTSHNQNIGGFWFLGGQSSYLFTQRHVPSVSSKFEANFKIFTVVFSKYAWWQGSYLFT